MLLIRRLVTQTAIVALMGGSVISMAASSKSPLTEETKIGGFALGCQAYTFNRFSVFEAIEKTREAGGKTIEFYPGQKLSRGDDGVAGYPDDSHGR